MRCWPCRPPSCETGGSTRRPPKAADKTVMGRLGQALLRSHPRRGGRLAGCSQATDGSEERQRKPLVGRRVGQEAWERPGTSILARPSLCGSGSPGAPASTYSLMLRLERAELHVVPKLAGGNLDV